MPEKELNIYSLDERMKRIEKELEELRTKIHNHIHKIREENKSNLDNLSDLDRDERFYISGPPY